MSSLKPFAPSGIALPGMEGALPGILPFAPDRRLVRRDPEMPRRRTRIWELNDNLHCSVIGTCLSTRELRQAMARIGVDRRDLSDHELHTEAVRAAGRHDAAGKILTKVLDQRHRVAIHRLEPVAEEEELGRLWADSVRQGDIPGAYWALLTHPFVTQRLIRTAFGEVHMLSHLVGAANRADIRRLAQLEEELAELGEKFRRQQVHLRDAIVSRDTTIRQLQATLAEHIATEAPRADGGERTTVLEACIATLERRLAAESRRRESAEQALEEARETVRTENAARARAASHAQDLAAELAALEAAWSPDEAEIPPPSLAGTTLLYVGGRTHQVPRLRAVAERLGANLLHHDGGLEESGLLLAGLVARADCVLFPVDCISHEAALMVKRLCRNQGKRFQALRSSGASSLLAALAQPIEA
jgi:Uncharacterized protein conserved in bacteria (DUF2325)